MAITSSIVVKSDIAIDGMRKTVVPIGGSYVTLKGALGFIGQAGMFYPFGTSGVTCVKPVIANQEVDNVTGTNLSVEVLETGVFTLTGSGLSQSSVGSIAYASDNATIRDVAGAGYIPVGTITRYRSTTSCDVALNEYGNKTVDVFVAMTAATDVTAGAVLNLLNPLGVDCMVENIVLKLTTAPTDTSAGIDVGIAATGTSNDSLLDGAVLAAAGYFSCNNKPGTNGGADRKLAAAQYITATSSIGANPSLAAAVGYFVISLKVI